jgi:hypothetical protein
VRVEWQTVSSDKRTINPIELQIKFDRISEKTVGERAKGKRRNCKAQFSTAKEIIVKMVRLLFMMMMVML